MANVNWINGTINPPESGEYYVILEAKRKRIRKKYHDRIMREYGGESNGQA